MTKHIHQLDNETLDGIVGGRLDPIAQPSGGGGGLGGILGRALKTVVNESSRSSIPSAPPSRRRRPPPRSETAADLTWVRYQADIRMSGGACYKRPRERHGTGGDGGGPRLRQQARDGHRAGRNSRGHRGRPLRLDRRRRRRSRPRRAGCWRGWACVDEDVMTRGPARGGRRPSTPATTTTCTSSCPATASAASDFELERVSVVAGRALPAHHAPRAGRVPATPCAATTTATSSASPAAPASCIYEIWDHLIENYLACRS